MLVVLFGPSCIGKTSIQQGLIDKSHKIKAIRCFQTRVPRDTDIGRVHVKYDKYKELLADDAIAITNKHFGNYYGTSKVDLERSSNSDDIYTLDFLIKDRHLLSKYSHKKIIVVPDSLNQVLQQMHSAGRQDREEAIIEDYQKHYSDSHLKELKKDGFFFLPNSYNNLTNSIDKLQEYLL